MINIRRLSNIIILSIELNYILCNIGDISNIEINRAKILLSRYRLILELENNSNNIIDALEEEFKSKINIILKTYKIKGYHK